MNTIKAMLNAATIQSTMVNGGRWLASLPFDDFFLALSFIDTAPSFFPYHLPDHAARHNVWRQSMPFPANEAVEKVSSFAYRAVNQNKYQGRSKGQYFGEANGALQTHRHQPPVPRC